MKTDEYIIPVYYVGYLIYGDSDLLDDVEIRYINEFISKTLAVDGVWDIPENIDEEQELSIDNSIDNCKMCDCIKVKYNYAFKNTLHKK